MAGIGDTETDAWGRVTYKLKRGKEEDVEKQLFLLGIGLLQKGTPELIAFLGLQEDQLAIECGESVIHHNVHPLAKVPETEVEDAGVPGEGGRQETTTYIVPNAASYPAVLLQWCLHRCLWMQCHCGVAAGNSAVGLWGRRPTEIAQHSFQWGHSVGCCLPLIL